MGFAGGWLVDFDGGGRVVTKERGERRIYKVGRIDYFGFRESLNLPSRIPQSVPCRCLGNAGFYIMERVSIYIDGENFYVEVFDKPCTLVC